MRINAGRHRGVKLAAPAGGRTRPTSDRARQAIFNILSHGRHSGLIEGARVLDAFAGTGAMGLEALSRGAASLVAFDTDRAALRAIEQNAARCRRSDDCQIVEADAVRPPPVGRYRDFAPCSLVFLDPPYGKGLAAAALAALDRAGWIASTAAIVVELSDDEEFAPNERFPVETERRYGRARIVFLSAAPQR